MSNGDDDFYPGDRGDVWAVAVATEYLVVVRSPFVPEGPFRERVRKTWSSSRRAPATGDDRTERATRTVVFRRK